MILIVVFLTIVLSPTVRAWTVDELALFDLVEEVDQNFYKFLGVEQDASGPVIRRAYRKLSLVWHPDKNKDEGASEQFRRLAAVYDVLKDDELRKRYDQVLEFGLPDWRQPVFYYRQLRKMPWWESALFMLLILSIGHYLVLWAIFFEKKLELDSVFVDKLRRKEKKLRKAGLDVDDLIAAEMNTIPKPRWLDLLPFLLCRVTIQMVLHAPTFFKGIYLVTVESLREYMKPEDYSDQNGAVSQEEENLNQQQYDQRIRRQRIIDEAYSADSVELAGPISTSVDSTPLESLDEIYTGSWTAEEISELIRLSNRYPMGTPDRWARIARLLRRKVDHVTDMIGELKRLDPKEYQKLSNMCQSSSFQQHKKAALVNNSLPESTQRHPDDLANDDADSPPSVSWNSNQQKCLEQALVQFPKTATARWDSISRCVPGKTKEECIARYKELVEAIKSKKKVAANQ